MKARPASRAAEQPALAEAKAHLSEVFEDVETEHRRVAITKPGAPGVDVLAVADCPDNS